MLRSGSGNNQPTASHDCYHGCTRYARQSWLGQRGWNRGILPAGRVKFRSASYQVSTPRRADQDLTLQCVLVGGSHVLGIIGVCAVFGLTWFKDRRVHTIWRGGDSGEQQTPNCIRDRATLHTWQPSLPLGPNSVGGWQDWRCCWREEGFVPAQAPPCHVFFSPPASPHAVVGYP